MPASPEEAGPSPLVPGEGQPQHDGGAHAEGAPRGDGQDGDEHRGRRRRRRGRRGGRNRHGEGAPYEGQAQEQGGPVPPVIMGPGHDLPPDSPFAAPAPAEPMRVEGPGDAHDWPWNRREERFPEEREPAPEPAPQHSAPARDEEPPRAAPRAEPPAAEPPREAEPTREEPKGPPRKGWWSRLTS